MNSRQFSRFVALTLVLFAGACCWDRVRPIVPRTDMPSAGYLELLGEPSLRKAGVAADLTSVDLEGGPLVALVARLPRDTPVQLLKWKSKCVISGPEYFAAIFNPATGKILMVGTEPLYAGLMHTS